MGKKCLRHTGRRSQETVRMGTEASASCGPKTVAVLVHISDIFQKNKNLSVNYNPNFVSKYIYGPNNPI